MQQKTITFWFYAEAIGSLQKDYIDIDERIF